MLPLPIAAAKTNLQAEMRALPDVETGKDQSGSTAVMTLLSPTHVICSNTGDSRAVLCRGGCRGSESKRRHPASPASPASPACRHHAPRPGGRLHADPPACGTVCTGAARLTPPHTCTCLT